MLASLEPLTQYCFTFQTETLLRIDLKVLCREIELFIMAMGARIKNPGRLVWPNLRDIVGTLCLIQILDTGNDHNA